MRAVLDPNVIISATLSPGGMPGRLFRLWFEGAYELVVSAMLLDELERAFGYLKLQDRVPTVEARELLEILSRSATHFQDPDKPTDVRSPDPDDDYLIGLAAESRSVLVSGESDLLGLSGQIPVRTPGEFLAMIEQPNSNLTQ
ncbi:MAG: putative toxin-antitoxin system toxin component, PIN family [Acidimicrobiia bacterium]